MEMVVLGAERGRRSEKSSSSICGEETGGKLSAADRVLEKIVPF